MSSPKRIYLDYAAATPTDPAVAAAMRPFESDQFANPASLYTEGRAAESALEGARRRIAKVLSVKAGEITLTAGSTEAINLTILGVGRRHPGGRIVASAIEHQAVLGCLDALAAEGHPTALVPVGSDGLVKAESLMATIDDDAILACIGLANSEIGAVQPLIELGQVIKAVRADRQRRGIDRPLWFMTDASAAAGLVGLQIDRWAVDLLVVGGAKLYGPKLSAALYTRAGIDLVPLIYGGGQERGRRSGTPSVGLAVGLATALELAEARRADETKRLAELRDRLQTRLLEIDGVSVNGGRRRLPSNLNVTIAGVSGEELVYALDGAGLAVATGAACSASSDQPSHVLLAIGLSAAEANQSLRLTLGRPTTAAEVDHAAKLIETAVTALRQRSI